MVDKKLNQTENDLRDALDRDDVYFNEKQTNNALKTSKQESIELDDAREKLSKWFPQ